MVLEDLRSDREPEPGARGRTRLDVAAAEVPLTDPRDLALGDARTVVAHGHDHVVVAVLARAHRHAAAARRVLRDVREQVLHHTFDQAGVGLRGETRLDVQLHLVPSEKEVQSVDDGGQQDREVDLGHRGSKLAGLELGEIEELCDHVVEGRCVRVQPREEVDADLLVERVPLMLERAAHPRDHGQRRSEFVRHGREEIVLHAVQVCEALDHHAVLVGAPDMLQCDARHPGQRPEDLDVLLRRSGGGIGPDSHHRDDEAAAHRHRYHVPRDLAAPSLERANLAGVGRLADDVRDSTIGARRLRDGSPATRFSNEHPGRSEPQPPDGVDRGSEHHVQLGGGAVRVARGVGLGVVPRLPSIR